MRMHDHQWVVAVGVRHVTSQYGAVVGQVVGTWCLTQVIVEVPALEDPALDDVPSRCFECARHVARLGLAPLAGAV